MFWVRLASITPCSHADLLSEDVQAVCHMLACHRIELDWCQVLKLGKGSSTFKCIFDDEIKFSNTHFRFKLDEARCFVLHNGFIQWLFWSGNKMIVK